MHEPKQKAASNLPEPWRLNLPGFIDEEIGLGSVIQSLTRSIGIRSCAGCRRRADSLNRRMVLSPGRRGRI